MNSPRVLPDHTSPKELADQFGSFFHDKIKTICKKLDNVHISTLPLTITLTESCKSSFTDFKQVSEDTVCNVINESASKCCQLGPIPTWLVKKCLDELLPHISKIICRFHLVQCLLFSNCPTLCHCWKRRTSTETNYKKKTMDLSPICLFYSKFWKGL